MRRSLRLTCFFFALAGPAGADIRLEAETYIAFGDAGGTPVHMAVCSAASQGLAVDGLDVAGDWIELRVSFTEPACVDVRLRSAGVPGYVRGYALAFTPDPPGTAAGVDTLVTPPGLGIT